MCGGGVGSANDSSNDDEKDSGNSFSETMANLFTPGDGMSYVDGQLVDNRSANDPSRKTFYDYSPSNNSDDGPGYTESRVDGKKRRIRRDANDAYKQKYASALFGAATGGLPGIIGSLVTNKITQGATGQAALNAADTAGGMFKGIGIKSLFGEPEFANAEEKAEYREKQRARRDAMMASMMDSDNDAPAQTVTIPEETGLPAATVNMSQEAAQGAFQPIPNPDYDPNDPMSPRFLLNPTYAQLLAYKQSQGEVVPMAEGGEVTGGNEKTMIADAVSAVKGEMSQEESAIVLGQFLAAYGEDALRDLVDKVQSGELDDTVDRFANGEAGEVNGPGDGSGVDDKVPASLEGQQDVLLADGEFVLRKKTADALEKKYGGGFLDAINEAETDAPRTMREYMAKRA
jgi:hypothetical protein